MNILKTSILFSMAGCLLLCSCAQQATYSPEDCKSGVVLILNQSFYEISMPDGSTAYFSDFDDEEGVDGFTTEEDSIEVSIAYGTGFFITENGVIVTNNHVVYGADEEAMRNYIAEAAELSEEDTVGMRIIYHNAVSIAYNDSQVEDYDDFEPCTIISADPEHDLALIQLDSKKTPDDAFVFTVPQDDGQDLDLSENRRLYMLSYNYGIQLALTEEGIKLQINNGTISQQTGNEMLYSIPALPGSSGSPVINQDGTLVAVNYAGLSETQNFNYGIRIRHLNNLIRETGLDLP